MANPNGMIQGSNGVPIELVDAKARTELTKKLTKPETAKVGDYLRVKAVNEDGTMDLEAVPAPTVPTKVSELTNDAGYQTAAQVNALLAAFPTFEIQVVAQLPAEGAEKTIYLVPFADDSGSYLEYLYVNGAWEIIGSHSGENLNLTVETITVGEESGGAVPVTGITLDYTSLSLKAGDMMQLAAMVTPGNATNTAVIWETSDGNVATVSDGLVTARAEGNAVITARSAENSSITAACAVSVAAAESGGGDEPGEDTGGGTAGQKIQFSTLTLTEGGIKSDGTAHTLGGTYHVSIPYTEGMYIRTLWNVGWAASTYPAFLVAADGGYTIPAHNSGLTNSDGETTITVGSKISNFYDATLSGYAEGATVIVNMLIGNAYDGANYNGISMNGSDWLYYIPGGES